MRISRLLATAVVSTSALPLLLTGSAAHADAPSGPIVTSATYPAYANQSLTVTATVTDSSSTVTQVEAFVGDGNGQPVEAALTVTPTGGGAYSATGSVPVTGFADNQTLYVDVDAADSAGAVASDSHNDYEDDDKAVVVDRDPPAIIIRTGSPLGQASTTITGTFTIVDRNAASVTATCSLDGVTPMPCISPFTYQNVAVGTHTITVTATDGAGNVASQQESVRIYQDVTVTMSLLGGNLLQHSVRTLRVLVTSNTAAAVVPTGTVTLVDNDGDPGIGDAVVGTSGLHSTANPLVAEADIPVTLKRSGTTHELLGYYDQRPPLLQPAHLFYVAVPARAVTLKLGKVSHGKLAVQVFCPLKAATCTGSLALGKAKAKYTVLSGHHSNLALALGEPTLASLTRHDKVTLRLAVNDPVKKRTQTIHLV